MVFSVSGSSRKNACHVKLCEGYNKPIKQYIYLCVSLPQVLDLSATTAVNLSCALMSVHENTYHLL